MSNFAALKKSSGSNLAKLTKAVEAMSSNNRNEDAGDMWKLTLDKSSNGFAVIRFLPTPPQDLEKDEDALPWVKYFDHGFQGPTGLWYIEKSLTTIGKQDSIGQLNNELWNSGVEANKEQARKQKRRLHYVSNIYVVKDSGNPDNEGKTFKFIFGKKIFERITQAMQPQFEDDTPLDPFDLWSGANFKLKARKVDGNVNYDLSEWAVPGPLSQDDDELEKIYNSTYSLLQIIDEKNFKTVEELDARLKRVLGIDQPKPKFQSAEQYSKSKFEDDELPFVEESKPTPKPKPTPAAVSFDEEDEDLDYFSKLIDD